MAHAFAQRREYHPGAPLYAAKDLKFSGRAVAHGALIPADYLSPEQHRALWRAGHANHTPKPLAYPMPPTLPSSLAEMEARKLPAPSPTPSLPPIAEQTQAAPVSSSKHRRGR